MKKFLIAVLIYTFSLAIGLVSVLWLVSDVVRTLITLLFISLLDIKFFELLFNNNDIVTFHHDKIERRVSVIKFFYFTMAVYSIFINIFFPEFAKYYSRLLFLEWKIDINPWLFIFAVIGPILALLIGYSLMFFISKSELLKTSKIISIFQFVHTKTGNGEPITTSTIRRVCNIESLKSLVQYYEQIRCDNFLSEWDDKGIKIFQKDKNSFLVEIEQKLVTSDFIVIELTMYFLVEFKKEKINSIQHLDIIC